MDLDTHQNPSSFDSRFHQHNMAIHTDLYELTMLAGYLDSGLHRMPVCFEYFFRELPPDTGYAVFCGLDPLIHYFETLRFKSSDIDYLFSLNLFNKNFLKWLSSWRFNCDVWSVEEGSVVFPNEPLIRVEGSLGEAQLVESFLLNAINYPTLVATKASRICMAAGKTPVMEFGLRRAQGPDGALTGARAAFIGGCIGTSNCLAGKRYGIPVRGTHAHSWVMSFSSELEAFRSYAKLYPNNCILLVDTYDPVQSGIPNAITVFKSLRKQNPNIRPAIRIDSGDLATLSKIAYTMFLSAGFDDPLIVASNDLDEFHIAELRRQDARINAWGVGTRLITAKDFPALGGVYKLTSVFRDGEWVPRIKSSSTVEKQTNPGKKMTYRIWDKAGSPICDALFGCSEQIPPLSNLSLFDQVNLSETLPVPEPAHIQPILKQVVQKGKSIYSNPPLINIQNRTRDQVSTLIPEMKRLREPLEFPVGISPYLKEIKQTLINSTRP